MKKILALTLALCMVFALCACGSGGGTAAKTESGPFKPSGPVTMIVAYKAGNGTDITARILAKYAEKYIGQTIVIDNQDGGSGSKGWSKLSSSKPDGMTIGFINLPNFNSSIVKKLGTYTIDSFAPICNHVTETSVVVVRADDARFPDLQALVDYGKAHDGELIASTNGAQAFPKAIPTRSSPPCSAKRLTSAWSSSPISAPWPTPSRFWPSSGPSVCPSCPTFPPSPSSASTRIGSAPPAASPLPRA